MNILRRHSGSQFLFIEYEGFIDVVIVVVNVVFVCNWCNNFCFCCCKSLAYCCYYCCYYRCCCIILLLSYYYYYYYYYN